MPMGKTNTNVKTRGEVYTPGDIVELMLGIVGYGAGGVLGRHIMDNSCGDGAFLRAVARRYIAEARAAGMADAEVSDGLSTYIHGIEIDKEAHAACVAGLDAIAESCGIGGVRWDIVHGDALHERGYDGRMDFVVGNPPYVRVHNLNDAYDSVKSYRFAEGGMTDLYIVFFEIGLRMLSGQGKLCLITPSSFFSSVAGAGLRRHIDRYRQLAAVVDLGHSQPFKGITTYTAITMFENGTAHDAVGYSRYDDGDVNFVQDIPYRDLFIDGNIVLGTARQHGMLLDVEDAFAYAGETGIAVKNGFATLADGVFIGDFDMHDELVIDVAKASTLEWKRCVFPYVPPGALVQEGELRARHAAVYKYLAANRERLGMRSMDENAQGWYAFGRSQAIRDVFVDKVAVGPLVKTLDSIKLGRVQAGKGVYSGLYVTSPFSFADISGAIRTDLFLQYVALLRKYKSGGYYTFSSKDLQKFLVYMAREGYHGQQRVSAGN